MWDSNSDYDGGVNTFSPEGRILQVEYAMKAVSNGATILGLQTKDGVIIGVEKHLVSPLVESRSVEKIHQIDFHLCAASCGLVSDARALIDKARIEAQNHYFTFNEIISTSSVAETIGDTILGFGKGQDMPSRPFGVALLIAGCDNYEGPKLFLADPAGSFSEWKAKALGNGADNAQAELEQAYNDNLDLEMGKKIVLRVLRQTMQESVSPERVELAIVTPDPNVEKRFQRLSSQEVEAILKSL